MKIGIDISQIVYGTGVSNYTRNLVSTLVAMDKNNQYVLFGGSLRQKGILRNFTNEFQGKKNVNIRLSPISPRVADLLWNRIHKIPIDIFIGGTDVFHASDWTQPPTRAAKVTTIHDLVPLKFPETLQKEIITAHLNRLKWVKKECDLIIAVSKSTKKDIVELLEIPPDKIKVIYEAPHEYMDPNIQVKPEIVKKIFRKYNIKKPFFLSVATLEPRKNLPRVLEAMAKLPKSVQLVLVGKLGWGTNEIIQKIKKLGLCDRVVLTGYIPAQDLSILYKNAIALVYVSLYEGFGLSVLTALAAGLPVVISNVSSLPEVGGDAAFYVNPQDVDDIRQKMEKMLSLTPRARKEIISRGLVQAKKFSWQKTARQTLDVYKEAVKKF